MNQREEGTLPASITCDYLIVSCMDFRIQGAVRAWAAQHLHGEPYDYVGVAGSSKELDAILSQIDIARNLHRIKKVIVIHHEDCGAYGVQGTLEKHTADLRKAKQRIEGRYPELIVDTYFLRLDGHLLPIS